MTFTEISLLLESRTGSKSLLIVMGIMSLTVVGSGLIGAFIYKNYVVIVNYIKSLLVKK